MNFFVETFVNLNPLKLFLNYIAHLVQYFSNAIDINTNKVKKLINPQKK